MALRVAQVGGFDADNYGDALFPLLAERALRRRLGSTLELVAYGFRDLPPGRRPYAVRDLARLPAEIAGFDLLLLGGGQLVRGDPLGPAFRPASATVHDPLGVWLVPTVTALLAGVPVAWNAPGASPTIPPALDPLVAAAAAGVELLNVRDEQSARWLAERAGVSAGIVPDTAFALAATAPPPLGEEARAALAGLDGRPYAILQPCAELGPVRGGVDAALAAFAAGGRAVLELPIGPVNGDRRGVLEGLPVATHDPGSWPGPAAMVELIGNADAAVGNSYHLGVTAVAFGVPLLRPPSPPGWKYETLERLPGVTVLGTGEALPPPPARRPVADAARAMAAAVEAHWDRVAELASRGPQPRAVDVAPLLAALARAGV
jgi:Polysaccharide pyruvyl transferase